jgi:hypothetical protein
MICVACQAPWSCWCDLLQIIFPCTVLCTLFPVVVPVIVQNFWWCNVIQFSLVIYSLCLKQPAARLCLCGGVLLEGNASQYWLILWMLIAILVCRRSSVGLSGRRRWFSSMLLSFSKLATYQNLMVCRIWIYAALSLTVLLIILSVVFLQDRALPFQRYKDIPGKGHQICPFRLSSKLLGSPVIIVHWLEMS